MKPHKQPKIVSFLVRKGIHKTSIILLLAVISCVFLTPIFADFTLDNLRKVELKDDVEEARWMNDSLIIYTSRGYKNIGLFNLKTKETKVLVEGKAIGYHFAILKKPTNQIVFKRRIGSDRQMGVYNLQEDTTFYISDTVDELSFPWTYKDVVFFKADGQPVYTDAKGRRISCEKKFAYYEDSVLYGIKGDSSWVIDSSGVVYSARVSPDRKRIAYEGIYSGISVADWSHRKKHIGEGNHPVWAQGSECLLFDVSEDNGHNITASELYYFCNKRSKLTNSNDLKEMFPEVHHSSSQLLFVAEGTLYTAKIVNDN